MGTLLSGLRSRRTDGRRRWSELGRGQRVGLVASGIGELVMTTRAAVDLYRRPAELVRGRKLLWWPALFIQPVGPVACLTFGRRSR